MPRHLCAETSFEELVDTCIRERGQLLGKKCTDYRIITQPDAAGLSVVNSCTRTGYAYTVCSLVRAGLQPITTDGLHKALHISTQVVSVLIAGLPCINIDNADNGDKPYKAAVYT